MTERRFFGHMPAKSEDKPVAEIPENQVTMDHVYQWFKLKEELARLKAAEALLRPRIARHFFPKPDEGTNTFELKDGTGAQLKVVHVINRSVDEGALDALKDDLRKKHKIKVDDLIRYKPELVLGKYRELTDEERKVFDQVLIIKDGTPQVDIHIPKKPSAG